jgi:hypothetical protein
MNGNASEKNVFTGLCDVQNSVGFKKQEKGEKRLREHPDSKYTLTGQEREREKTRKKIR